MRTALRITRTYAQTCLWIKKQMAKRANEQRWSSEPFATRLPPIWRCAHALSGLAFLFPAWAAWTRRQKLHAAGCLLVATTSVAWSGGAKAASRRDLAHSLLRVDKATAYLLLAQNAACWLQQFSSTQMKSWLQVAVCCLALGIYRAETTLARYCRLLLLWRVLTAWGTGFIVVR